MSNSILKAIECTLIVLLCTTSVVSMEPPCPYSLSNKEECGESTLRDSLRYHWTIPKPTGLLILSPFGCASEWYQTYQTSPQWFIGAYDFSNLGGGLNVFGSYGNNSHKCIGYNTLDDHLYTIKGNGTVLRMHSDGTEDDLGDSTADDYFGPQMQVGGFDDSGNFYIKALGLPDVAIIDVTTSPASYTIDMAGGTDFEADDWAFHSIQGQFYGVENGTLWAYSPGGGVSSSALTGDATPGAFGSAYYTADGFIYVVKNSNGDIFKIDVVASKAQYVVTGPSTFNQPDGASCPTALPPFPTVCAVPDEFCLDGAGVVTAGTQFDNDIILQSTADFNSFMVTSGPSFGNVTYDAGTGEFTYTASGSPMADMFTYQVCASDLVSGQAVCSSAEISVIPSPPATFGPLGPYCQNSTPDLLPSTSIEGVSGTWTPATISTTTVGTSDYMFESNTGVGCEAMATINIEIVPTVDPLFSIGQLYCEGDTPPTLPTTSDNAVTGTWAPAMISTAVTGNTDYVFTPDDPSQCGTPFTLMVTVTPSVMPVFSLSNTYCQGDTEPTLPTTSDNGITGTWDAASISTTTVGMTNYTFTPDDPLQCGGTLIFSVTVTAEVLPAFTETLLYCENDTPGSLPTTSDNGITGTWVPAIISTMTIGNTDYTFSPDDPAQCGQSTMITINVVPSVTPTFTIGQMYCEGDTPPTLPMTSDNGITGTWSPAVISTTVTGSADYVFTPDDPSQCGTPFTLMVTVTSTVTPVFGLAATYCEGDTEPTLPTTSDNGITGAWVPTTISTSTVGMTDYTFTPDNPSQCAEPLVLMVTVTAEILPIFSISTVYCQGDTEPTLPLVSDNGITGTWDIGTISTSSTGMTNYTFSPDDPLQCGGSAVLMVNVLPTVTPSFSVAIQYCEGDTEPTLPTTSDNGITGTWAPTTISTSTVGMTDYTFTPDDPSQCGSGLVLSVNVSATVIPSFGLAVVYCEGDTEPTLPLVSDNGITGTWNATQISTTSVGNTNYIFSPDDPSQCGNPVVLMVTVTAEVTPTFSITTVYCEGDTEPTLPLVSDNGITGTWDITSISTSTVGLTNYIFTPDDNSQCGTNAVLPVTINAQVAAAFSLPTTYCLGDAEPTLPSVSDNGITGSWDASFISTSTSGTQTYTFTPDDPSQCSDVVMLMVTVDALVEPDFSLVDTYCVGDSPTALPSVSDDGVNGVWNPGVINTSSANTTIYTFTATDPGCFDTYDLSVTVNDCGCLNPAMVSIEPINPICEDDIVDLTAILSGSASTVTWTTTGNGTFDDNISLTPSYTPGTADIAAGLVTITATTDDPDGAGVCTPASVSINLIINMQVDPIFNIEDSYCENTVTDPLPAISDNGVSGSWSPSFIGNTTSDTYTFIPNTDECAATFDLNVTIVPIANPAFSFSDEYCEGDTPDALPSISDNGITGSWFPASINTTAVGMTDYTFNPDDPAQCGNMLTQTITVTALVAPMFSLSDEYCLGDVEPVLPLISDNGISGNWDAATISTSSLGTLLYTFTPDDPSQCGAMATLLVTIEDLILPTFSIVDTYCVDDNPAPLPAISDNGINGTWNPATINTANANTTTYTFTASDMGCFTTYDLIVTVDDCGCADPAMVSINSVDPICADEIANLMAVLGGSATSATWTTSGDGTFSNGNNFDTDYTPGTSDIASGSVTLTVTTDDPDGAGVCTEATSTINLLVEAEVSPIFNIDNEYCAGETTESLPTTSTNGISGTWSPLTIDNSNSSTYTFTPDSDQCAVPFDLTVTITPLVVPTFTLTDQYCVDDTPMTLPTTSDNGMTGTWTPATISTVSGGTTDYVFNPDGSTECADDFTLTVVVADCGCVNPAIVTTQPVSDICGTEDIDLVAVLGGSASSVTWTSSGTGSFDDASSLTPVYSPDGGDITNGSVTLTVTTDDPDGLGPCNSAIMDVIVNISAVENPAFTVGTEYCEGDQVDVLPMISDNGISGTWSPVAIDNSTSGIYTFTPASGECANETMIQVTVDPVIIPVFLITDEYCINDTPDVLPLLSDNGIVGTWSPTDINTSTAGNTIYTFTPDGNTCAGLVDLLMTIEDCNCADPAIVNIDPVGSICETEVASLTATLSGSATTITWTSAGDGTFDNNTSLTSVYTPGANDISTGSVIVTATTNDPDGAGECTAAVSSVSVTIQQTMTPLFDLQTMYCVGETPQAIPTTSQNGVEGTWMPAVVSTQSTGTTTYIFTPLMGACAQPSQLVVLVEDCGCTDPATVEMQSPTAVCEDDNPEPIAMIGGSATAILWTSTGDGSFDDATFTLPVYTLGPGDIAAGNVTLIVTTDDPDGAGPCEPATESRNVIIHRKPTAILAEQPSCADDMTTYSAVLTVNGADLVTSNPPSTVTTTDGEEFTLIGLPSGTDALVTCVNSLTGCSTLLNIVAPDCDCQSITSPVGPTDVSICFGEASADLSVEDPGAGFEVMWYDQLTGGIILATGINYQEAPPGTYFVEISEIGTNCNSDRLMVTLSEGSEITFDIGGEPTSCEVNSGSIEILNANGGSGNYTYSIDGGLNFQGSNMFDQLIAGSYDVVVRDDSGCSADDDAVVEAESAFDVMLGADIQIVQGSTAQLVVTTNLLDEDIATIVWSPAVDLSCTDCLNPISTTDVTMTYMVTVTDVNGCEVSDDITISVERVDKPWAPSVFSPTSTTGNDRFMLYPDPSIDIVETIFIMDRWGNKVYEANNIAAGDFSAGWSGRIGANTYVPGVYVYYASVRMLSGETEKVLGDITLIR